MNVTDELLQRGGSTSYAFLEANGDASWSGDINFEGTFYVYSYNSGSTFTLNNDITLPGWNRVYAYGPGTVVINGDLDARYGITSQSGTIEVNGTVSSEYQAMSVNNGTMAGTGTFNSSRQTQAYINRNIDPGSGSTTGTMTIDSPARFTNDGRLSLDINGSAPGTQHDQLVITGDIELGGTLNVTLGSSFAQVGDSFTIIDNQGTNPISGTFSGLPEQGLVEYGGNIFTVSYVGGDGNDVTLTLQTGNNFPVGDDQTVSTDEETPINITLTGNDPDGDVFTYSIESQPANGTLSGTVPHLTYTPPTNFEGTDNFDFRVTDTFGGFTVATVTIHVNGTQDSPTQINLSNASIEELTAVGTAIGTLSTVDPDANETFTYSLTVGAGDTDNALFSIDGDELKLAFVPDYETQTSHSVRVRSTDKGSNSVERAFTISIIDVEDPLNTPPTADAGGPYSVDEGGSVQLDGSGSSDPEQSAASLLYEWDLDGDGIFGEVGAGAGRGDETGITPTFSASGLDGRSGSSFDVQLRVTDDFGESDTDTETIEITNVAPSLSVKSGTVTVEEGATAINRVRVSDPGNDPVTVTASVGTVTYLSGDNWDWSFDTSDGPDQTQTVTFTATDKDGATSQATFDLVVTNVAPTVFTKTTSLTVPEGSLARTLGSVSDPGNDSVTVTASVGSVSERSPGVWEWSYDTLDGPDDSQTVTITATDSDGASSQTSFDLVVTNVAPSVAVTGASSVTVDEGQVAANSGTWSDPGVDTVSLSASVGSVTQNADGTWDWSFNTTDGPDESQFVVITATDSDGASSQTSFRLTVNNVLPVLTNDGNVTVSEGQVATTTGAWSDPGDDVVQLATSAGTVTQNADGTWSWSLATDDGPGESRLVKVTGTDGSKGAGRTEFTVTVNNVAPDASVSGPSTGLRGSAIDFSLGATDVSTADQNAGFTYDIDWNGDGTVDQTISGPDGLVVSHTFATAGTSTVIVTATDKDGGTSTQITHAIELIQPVDVDVKPGNAQNKVNAKSQGVIPVAIYTTADFDAATIDGSTVKLAGVNADHFALEDVDGDGDLDLILHFDTQDVIDSLGIDLDSGESVTVDAKLTGQTIDDVFIEGFDTIEFFQPGKGKGRK